MLWALQAYSWPLLVSDVVSLAWYDVDAWRSFVGHDPERASDRPFTVHGMEYVGCISHFLYNADILGARHPKDNPTKSRGKYSSR